MRRSGMRSRPIAAMLIALSLSTCAPYRIDHQHVVFDDIAGLTILERTSTAVDSQNRPLSNGKVGFPTKAVLKRVRYEIRFDLPPSSMPMLFLGIRASQGALLDAEGPHVGRVHPDAEVLGYQYYFDVNEAGGDPVELVIRGADGLELGRKRLTYKIQSRGVLYGIETL